MPSSAASRIAALCVPEPPSSPAERLRVALSLLVTAEAMFLERLRRQEPALDEDALERRLEAWLLDRSGAEGGDAVGTVRPWTTD